MKKAIPLTPLNITEKKGKRKRHTAVKGANVFHSLIPTKERNRLSLDNPRLKRKKSEKNIFSFSQTSKKEKINIEKKMPFN